MWNIITIFSNIDFRFRIGQNRGGARVFADIGYWEKLFLDIGYLEKLFLDIGIFTAQGILDIWNFLFLDIGYLKKIFLDIGYLQKLFLEIGYFDN